MDGRKIEMAEESEVLCWLALLFGGELKLIQAKRLIQDWCLAQGRSLAELFTLSATELQSCGGVQAAEIESLIASQAHLTDQAQLLERLRWEGVSWLIRTDPCYPAAWIRFLSPAHQPMLLFYRGPLELLKQPAVAILSSSQVGDTELVLAFELAAGLAAEGLNVVCGQSPEEVCQAVIEGALTVPTGGTTVVLSQGFSTFTLPTEEIAASTERERLLWLSPFHPNTMQEEKLVGACYKLIAGLAEVICVLTTGEEEMQTTVYEALKWGKPVLVWELPEGEPGASRNAALLEAGAEGIVDAEEALVRLRTLLGLKAHPTFPAVSPELEETELAPLLSPEQALAVLERGGKVPERLRQRLRTTSST